MHRSDSRFLVFWYDAITIEGELKWQNSLTPENQPFLDVCDGLFVNYHWKEATPRQIAQQTGTLFFEKLFTLEKYYILSPREMRKKASPFIISYANGVYDKLRTDSSTKCSVRMTINCLITNLSSLWSWGQYSTSRFAFLKFFLLCLYDSAKMLAILKYSRALTLRLAPIYAKDSGTNNLSQQYIVYIVWLKDWNISIQ